MLREVHVLTCKRRLLVSEGINRYLDAQNVAVSRVRGFRELVLPILPAEVFLDHFPEFEPELLVLHVILNCKSRGRLELFENPNI